MTREGATAKITGIGDGESDLFTDVGNLFANDEIAILQVGSAIITAS